MNLRKLIEQAKEEIEIGSVEKAEVLIEQAIYELDVKAVALHQASKQTGDPAECASTLDLILRNME